MRGHDLDQCCSDKVSHLRPDRRPARSADVGRQFSNVRHLRRPQHTVVFLFVRNSKTYRFSKQAVTDGIHEHGTAEATRAMFRDPSYTSYCPSKEMNGRGEKWFPAFHGVHMHGILERGQRFLLRPHGCRGYATTPSGGHGSGELRHGRRTLPCVRPSRRVSAQSPISSVALAGRRGSV